MINRCSGGKGGEDDKEGAGTEAEQDEFLHGGLARTPVGVGPLLGRSAALGRLSHQAFSQLRQISLVALQDIAVHLGSDSILLFLHSLIHLLTFDSRLRF